MISCQKHEISSEQALKNSQICPRLPLSHRKYWISLITSPGSQAKKTTLTATLDPPYPFKCLFWVIIAYEAVPHMCEEGQQKLYIYNFFFLNLNLGQRNFNFYDNSTPLPLEILNWNWNIMGCSNISWSELDHLWSSVIIWISPHPPQLLLK